MRKAILGAAALAALLAGAAAAAPPSAPGPRDRCSVCGMFVAPYPEWVAAARDPGGGVLYFDGPKDLFRRLASNPSAEAWVTGYYGVRFLDARAAWFVEGSDVLGPMGRELVPHATEEEAREFARDHRGARVLRFSDVTPALLESLR